jgi:hypothetical protein
LFLYAVLPRTVNTLANLVCGRLISARIESASTDVGNCFVLSSGFSLRWV